MVKSIRVHNDKIYSEFMKFVGQVQAETGEYTSATKALDILLTRAKQEIK